LLDHYARHLADRDASKGLRLNSMFDRNLRAAHELETIKE